MEEEPAPSSPSAASSPGSIAAATAATQDSSPDPPPPRAPAALFLPRCAGATGQTLRRGAETLPPRAPRGRRASRGPRRRTQWFRSLKSEPIAEQVPSSQTQSDPATAQTAGNRTPSEKGGDARDALQAHPLPAAWGGRSGRHLQVPL